MDPNIISETSQNIAILILIMISIPVVTWLIIYAVVVAISKSHAAAKLLGGLAFLIAFYFSFINVFLPSIA